jgi:LiaI-LiaF-like transmembrane region
MTGPILLITLGVLLLLNNLDPGTYSFTRLWPVILIALGVGRIGEYVYRRAAGRRSEERRERRKEE